MAASAVTIGLQAEKAEAATTRTDEGYTSLQDAVDACKAGDELQVQQARTITAPVTVNKHLTIRCINGGSITTIGNVHALNITASRVTVVNVNIAGAGTTAGTQALIRAVGTAGAPLTNLTIRECQLTRSLRCAVEIHHVNDFTIEGNTIRDVAYAGIVVLSSKRGRIAANRVSNVIQAGTWRNSYGIVLTRNGKQSITAAPRTSDVVVHGNIVDGVRKWEGIDSHGGQNITVTSNIVTNSFIGIALVPCPNASGVATYAPKGIVVRNNVVDSGVRNGTFRSGIQLVGAGSPARVTEYADGTVSGNTVTGYGMENSSTGAGITAQYTRRSTIASNNLQESSLAGIVAYQHNVDLSIKNNIIVDTWTNSAAYSACVFVNAANQSVTVTGNSAVRSSKKANKVNDRGLYITPAAKKPNTTVKASGNNFSACSKQLVDASKSHGLT